MTIRQAFTHLCYKRGALAGVSSYRRAAEIRWRIKHKNMWPLESTMYMYLTKAGYSEKNGLWTEPKEIK